MRKAPEGPAGVGAGGSRESTPGLRRATTRDLRRGNRAAIFRALHRCGGTGTRLEIAGQAGLSPATVSLLVGDLLRRGVLVAGEFEPPAGGRPRERIGLNSGFGQLIGIDVAETYIHARAFDLGLRPAKEWRLDHTPLTDADALIDSCVAAVQDLNRADVPLLGVGLSVPGLVDPVAGVALRSPDGVLHNVAIAARVAEALRLSTVHLDNPLRASVLAELWAGAGRTQPDLAALTLGTGVGAGLAVDGVLRRGSSHLAGEWGHIPVVRDGRRCRCGNRGCLEAYLGAAGIIGSLREHGIATQAAGSDQEAELAHFVRRLDAGDPAAAAVNADLAERLGDGLLVLRHVVDPAVVVAGGWVAQVLGQRLLEPAEAVVGARSLRAPDAAPWLVLSVLGELRVTLGAAALVLADVVERW